MFVILKYIVYSILISVVIVPIYFVSATLYFFVNIFSVILNLENHHSTFYEYRLSLIGVFKDYIEHITIIKEYYKQIN